MTDDFELEWKRNPETGHYLATDHWDGATYVTARDDRARPGRQWTLTVAVPGRNDTQTRAGFATNAGAQGAALQTRCHRCSRHVRFATLEQSGSGSWVCRDHAECEAVAEARNEEERQISREIRSTPWTKTLIRDTEGGPELIIRFDTGNGYVIPATDKDILTLAWTALEWLRARWAAELHEIRKAAGS